jgi:dihydrodiol dehydrogenase / D-xylose 1-dehydrogenase (NADP)
MASPQTVRWGILATGKIAETFSKDLLVDPQTRGVKNVKHTIVAASSSSSKDRAQEFLRTVGADSSAKAYGSYEEFVKDSDVDIVYVATPHSHHFQNVMLCLEAGKNVLCEKAFTVNADQLKLLVKKAREKVSSDHD